MMKGTMTVMMKDDSDDNHGVGGSGGGNDGNDCHYYDVKDYDQGYENDNQS